MLSPFMLHLVLWPMSFWNLLHIQPISAALACLVQHENSCHTLTDYKGQMFSSLVNCFFLQILGMLWKCRLGCLTLGTTLALRESIVLSSCTYCCFIYENSFVFIFFYPRSMVWSAAGVVNKLKYKPRQWSYSIQGDLRVIQQNDRI